jgi:hypothetical protein
LGEDHASISFTIDDLDAAMLQVYSESLDMLEELVLGALAALSDYAPGRAALKVPQPDGLWPDYNTTLSAVVSRGRGNASTG